MEEKEIIIKTAEFLVKDTSYYINNKTKKAILKTFDEVLSNTYKKKQSNHSHFNICIDYWIKEYFKHNISINEYSYIYGLFNSIF